MPPMVLPTKEGAGSGPRYAPEVPPPKGERNRKLVDDGCIVAAREERLLDIWCRKLQEELLEIDAPIISTLRGSLDPDRAALLLVGKTRASTSYFVLAVFWYFFAGFLGSPKMLLKISPDHGRRYFETSGT